MTEMPADSLAALTAGSTTQISASDFGKLQADPAVRELIRQKIIALVVRGDMAAGIAASHFVGQAILTDGRRLLVRERRPGTLQALLNWSLPAELREATVVAPVSESPGSALLEQFARRFVTHLADYLSAGRLKEYVTVLRRSSTPRGRIDMQATVADRARAKTGTLVSRSPVLTADTKHNRLLGLALRAVDDYLEAQPSAQDTVDIARVFSPLFDDVSWHHVERMSWERKRETFRQVLNDRRTSGALRASLEFARAVVLHLGPWPEEEWTEGPPVSHFVNLWLLFQEAIFNIASRVAAVEVMRGRELQVPLFPTMPESYIADPDLVFGPREHPSLVADCKFKELSGVPGHSDVYQLVAHCAATSTSRGLLIFPGDEFAVTDLGITLGGIQILWATIRPECLREDLREVLSRTDVPLLEASGANAA